MKMVSKEEITGKPGPDDPAWRVLDYCAANNIATDEAVVISSLCAWMEAEGVPHERLLECVTGAITYGWLDVVALPGQVRLTELGFAFMTPSGGWLPRVP
jgi:hypothetical protein